MKKTLFITFLFMLTLFSTYAQTHSGGSGTVNAPYLISSEADMIALANAVNNGTNYSYQKYFLLTQDLTIISTVIGYSSTTRYTFQGVFDGGGILSDWR